MNIFRKHIFLLIVFCITINCSFAQADQPISKKDADKLYEKKEYQKAATAYLSIFDKYADNAKFNLKLGTCLFKSNVDKSECIPFLKFAVENLGEKKNIEARFLLSKAYHLSYDFSNALVQLELLKASKYKKLLFDKDFNVLIAQCKVGAELVKNAQNIQVLAIESLKKQELFSREPFFYENSDTSIRTIKIKPIPLRTLDEARFKEKLLLLQIEKGKKLYYPEYKFNKYGRLEKDIVYDYKAPRDQFAERQDIGPLINSNYDENYPYLHTDNKTMYFVSNGPESMGGYDVFKSELDSVTGYWGLPQNLGFPINSVYDEFIYVPNQENKHIYFSSNRFLNEEELSVYKILPPKTYSNDVIFKVNKFVEGKNGQSNKKILQINIADELDKQMVSFYKPSITSNHIMLSLPELTPFTVEVIFSDSSKQIVEWFTPLKSRHSEINLVDFIQNGKNLEYGIVKPNTIFSDQEKIKIYTSFSYLQVNTNLVIKDEVVEQNFEFEAIVDSISAKNWSNYLLKIKNEKIDVANKISSYIWLADQRKNSSAILLNVFDSLKTKLQIEGKLLPENELLILNSNLQKIAKKIEFNFNEIIIAMSNINADKSLINEMNVNIRKTEKLLQTQLKQSNKGDQSYFKLNAEQIRVNRLKLESKLADKKLVELKMNERILKIKNLDSLMLNENIKRQSKIGFLNDEKEYLTDEYNDTWRKKKKSILKREIDAIDKKLFAIQKRQKKLDKKNNTEVITNTNIQELEILSSWFAIYKPMELVNIPDQAASRIDFENLTINQKLLDWVSKNKYSSDNIKSDDFFTNAPKFTFVDSVISVTKTKTSAKSDNFISADIASLKKMNLIPELQEKNIDGTYNEIVSKAQIPNDYSNNSTIKIRVKAKETLLSLSRKYQTTVEEIKALNVKSPQNPFGIDWDDPKRLDPTKDFIYLGESIIVPNNDTEIDSYFVKRNRKPLARKNRYQVQKKENIFMLARRFNISVEKLKDLNLKSAENPDGIDWNDVKRTDPNKDWIYVGEVLIVPDSTLQQNGNLSDVDLVIGKTYISRVVKKGDSLSKIAQQYKISLQELKDINAKGPSNPNGIDWEAMSRKEPQKDWIYEGEILILPEIE